MSEIKCIASDLDGTLLQSRGRIAERTRKALCAAIASGIEFVPLSGRPYKSLPSDLFEIPDIHYCSTSNGAAIQDFKTGKRLFGLIPQPVMRFCRKMEVKSL